MPNYYAVEWRPVVKAFKSIKERDAWLEEDGGYGEPNAWAWPECAMRDYTPAKLPIVRAAKRGEVEMEES